MVTQFGPKFSLVIKVLLAYSTLKICELNLKKGNNLFNQLTLYSILDCSSLFSYALSYGLNRDGSILSSFKTK